MRPGEASPGGMMREQKSFDKGGGRNGGSHSSGKLLIRGPGWKGPIVDYKELELLRKFMTGSSKVMSRKRSGTTAQQQDAVKNAIKHARFMALLPYCGT